MIEYLLVWLQGVNLDIPVDFDDEEPASSARNQARPQARRYLSSPSGSEYKASDEELQDDDEEEQEVDNVIGSTSEDEDMDDADARAAEGAAAEADPDLDGEVDDDVDSDAAAVSAQAKVCAGGVFL